MLELAMVEQRKNVSSLGKQQAKHCKCSKKVFDDEALSQSTVFERHKKFKNKKESLEDDEHSGRPRNGRSLEQVMKVSDDLKKHHCVQTRLFEDMSGFIQSTVLWIQREDLTKRKVCAKFVPALS